MLYLDHILTKTSNIYPKKRKLRQKKLLYPQSWGGREGIMLFTMDYLQRNKQEDSGECSNTEKKKSIKYALFFQNRK